MDSKQNFPHHISHRISDDGSSTLYSDLYQAHYHSTHGAIQESLHIFIEHGLHAQTCDPIHILEYGLGTGLNLFLTAKHSLNRHVHYKGLELHPVRAELLSQLNYAQTAEDSQLFNQIHDSNWDVWHQLTDQFAYYKAHMKFEDYHPEEEYDLIYYDAFAPSSQEHLWNTDMMSTCYNALKKNGFLITYCAKGSFKRALREVGFEVVGLPGPPGKREMTKAVKS